MMDNLKPKEPLLAVMLSTFLTGMGQVYSGKVSRGIAFFFIPLLSAIFLMLYLINPITPINIFVLAPVAILIIFGIWIIFDAYHCAKSYNLTNNLERKISGGKKALLIVGIIFFAFIFNPCQIVAQSIASYIKSNVVQAYKFPSGSMEPTIQKQDRLLADKAIYKKSKPQRGDLVVFTYPPDPKKQFVKRLIAYGGETVEIKDGHIYINGQPCADAKIKDRYYYNKGDYGQANKPVVVPEEAYYILGDNSASSMDSRYWGFVPNKNVSGKIYKIYWPMNRSGKVE